MRWLIVNEELQIWCSNRPIPLYVSHSAVGVDFRIYLQQTIQSTRFSMKYYVSPPGIPPVWQMPVGVWQTPT